MVARNHVPSQDTVLLLCMHFRLGCEAGGRTARLQNFLGHCFCTVIGRRLTPVHDSLPKVLFAPLL